MCIIVVAVGKHPDFPLIIAHNREESWSRPTGLPQEHSPGVVFAKDLQAGGTYMGVNFQSGAFAALTNVRSTTPRPSGGRSRGELVTGAIGASQPVDPESIPEFTAFNMWTGSIKAGTPEVSFIRSWPAPAAPHGWQSARSTLPPGSCISHSNEPSGDQWDTSWPKTHWLQSKATALLDDLPAHTTVEALRNTLGDLMLESNPFNEDEMPDLSFSPLERWKEIVCQRGPRVCRRGASETAALHGLVDWAQGTMSQTLLILDANQVHYFYRSTKNMDQTPGEWMCFSRPGSEAVSRPPLRLLHQSLGLQRAAVNVLIKGSTREALFGESLVGLLGDCPKAALLHAEDGAVTLVAAEGRDAVPLGHYATPRYPCSRTLSPIQEWARKRQQMDSGAAPEGSEPPVRLACVVIPYTAQGDVLVSQRVSRAQRAAQLGADTAASTTTYSGMWVFPGGHINHGESPAEAGVREVLEETGIHINAESLRLVALWEASVVPQSKQWLMVCYTGLIEETDVASSLRIQEAEVNAVGLFPASFVEHLRPGVADGVPQSLGAERFPGVQLVPETSQEADSCLGNGGVAKVMISVTDVVEGMHSREDA